MAFYAPPPEAYGMGHQPYQQLGQGIADNLSTQIGNVGQTARLDRDYHDLLSTTNPMYASMAPDQQNQLRSSLVDTAVRGGGGPGIGGIGSVLAGQEQHKYMMQSVPPLAHKYILDHPGTSDEDAVAIIHGQLSGGTGRNPMQGMLVGSQIGKNDAQAGAATSHGNLYNKQADLTSGAMTDKVNSQSKAAVAQAAQRQAAADQTDALTQPKVGATNALMNQRQAGADQANALTQPKADATNALAGERNAGAGLKTAQTDQVAPNAESKRGVQASQIQLNQARMQQLGQKIQAVDASPIVQRLKVESAAIAQLGKSIGNLQNNRSMASSKDAPNFDQQIKAAQNQMQIHVNNQTKLLDAFEKAKTPTPATTQPAAPGPNPNAPPTNPQAATTQPAQAAQTKPAPIPDDRSAWVVGQIYQGKAGHVARYLGNDKFESVQ